ncbi:hypothetical protein V6N13_117158 [Hibiscus sabdariffa]
MTKGMPRQGGNGSCPGRYFGSYWTFSASAGNSALGGKIYTSRKICTILLKSAMAENLLPAVSAENCLPAVSAENNQLGRVNLLWQEICLILLNSAVAGSPTLPRQMS